jgi:hypothetical protein
MKSKSGGKGGATNLVQLAHETRKNVIQNFRV